jgi:hypothetical protein
MLETSIHLLKFVLPDSSCTRDKVNRAAGRPRLRTSTDIVGYVRRSRRGQARWCFVFCSPSGLFHRDPKFTAVTRTGYRQDNLSWPKTYRPPTGTGGYRSALSQRQFMSMDTAAYFWTFNTNTNTGYYSILLKILSSGVYSLYLSKQDGLSIRCIKN